MHRSIGLEATCRVGGTGKELFAFQSDMRMIGAAACPQHDRPMRRARTSMSIGTALHVASAWTPASCAQICVLASPSCASALAFGCAGFCLCVVRAHYIETHILLEIVIRLIQKAPSLIQSGRRKRCLEVVAQ